MSLTTRVGVQTHHRPSNYDGPWLYFENYGNIAPLTARYLPNSYGILVFLLESPPQRRLRREARRRVGRGRGGERANGAEANRIFYSFIKICFFYLRFAIYQHYHTTTNTTTTLTQETAWTEVCCIKPATDT